MLVGVAPFLSLSWSLEKGILPHKQATKRKHFCPEWTGLRISTSFFLATDSSVSWRDHVIIMLNYEALIGHPYSVPTFTRNSLVDNFCCKYYTKILPSGWNVFKFWMKGRARIQKFTYFLSQICNLSQAYLCALY